MSNLLARVKQLFGIYEPNTEYTVPLNKIIVPKCYMRSTIGQKKWIHKLNYFENTGTFESKIIVRKDGDLFRLVDGYSSVKIAYIHNIKKVPVWFV